MRVHFYCLLIGLYFLSCHLCTRKINLNYCFFITKRRCLIICHTPLISCPIVMETLLILIGAPSRKLIEWVHQNRWLHIVVISKIESIHTVTPKTSTGKEPDPAWLIGKHCTFASLTLRCLSPTWSFRLYSQGWTSHAFVTIYHLFLSMQTQNFAYSEEK
jgi:hypothetical protein